MPAAMKEVVGFATVPPALFGANEEQAVPVGETGTEEHDGETLDQRLEQEEPDDTDRDDYDQNAAWPDDMVSGAQRRTD